MIGYRNELYLIISTLILMSLLSYRPSSKNQYENKRYCDRHTCPSHRYDAWSNSESQALV